MAWVGYVEIAMAVLSYFLLVLWHRRSSSGLPSWPFLGMLPDLLLNVRRAHDFVSDWLARCGGTLEFRGPWLTAMNFVVTCDPSNVQHILTSNFANYPKGPHFRELFDALGGGIFNVDSDAWRTQRKMFHDLVVGPHSSFTDVVAKTIRQKLLDDLLPDLVHACEDGDEMDLQESLQRMTFDNTFALIFGLDSPIYQSLKLPVLEYQKAFAEMEEAGWHRHVLPKFVWRFQRWLQTGGEKRIRHARIVFDDFLFHCVAQKRQEYLANKTKPLKPETETDLMTMYLKDAEKTGTEYSDKFLRDTAFNFMVAGISSVNACMTWFFWLVATNPRVEAKILDEMKRNIPAGKAGELEEESRSDGGFAGLFGPAELAKMVYLHAVFLETLRLYPPVPFNHKTAANSDVLPSGHRVRPGAMILTSFYAMGRSEAIWGKDSREFRPERWITERASGPGILYVPSYKFTTFNTGPRSCLGKDMSLLQMKSVAAAVLWKFRLRAVDGHPVVPTVSIVLHMEHGLKVWVSKREH